MHIVNLLIPSHDWHKMLEHNIFFMVESRLIMILYLINFKGAYHFMGSSGLHFSYPCHVHTWFIKH